MTKRKYKVFRDIVLVVLCILPLVAMLFAMAQSSTFVNYGDFNEFVSRFAISQDLANKIGDCINTFGISFDGAFFPAATIIISNSLLIYSFYLFVALLVWIPKFAIRLLSLDGKD